jgi:flagellar FliL protein
MADHGEAASAGAAKGGGKKKFLIMGLAGVLLGGGGLGGYLFMKKGSGASAGHEKEAAADDHGKKDDGHGSKGGHGDDGHAGGKKEGAVIDTPNKGKIVTLNPIVVNLRDTGGSRYLKVSIGMETNNDDVVKEIKDISIQLSDFLNERLSNVRIQEVDNLAGRNKLKRELMQGTNELLEKGAVTQLYFSEFVIQ